MRSVPDFLSRYAARAVFIFVFCLIAFFPLPLLETGNLRAIVCWSLIPVLALFTRAFKGLAGKSDIFLFVFLALLSAGLLNAVDRKAAQESYLTFALVFVSMYYLGKLMYSREPGFCSAVICISACVISIIAFAELGFRRNVLYECLENPFYLRYLGVRPMSTQYNPAALGSFLLGCLPFFGFLVLRKGRRSWLALAGFAACLSVLIWTFSRGVFLGLIAAVFFFCLMSGRKRLLAGFLLGVCCLVAVFSFSSNLNLNRFGFSRFIAGSQDSVFSPYRMTRLQITGAMVKDHPFTGIGLNNFRVRFADYQPSAARESYEFMIADNMYLTLAAEAGLPCLAAFLLFIAMLFRGHPGATRRSVAALLPMTALVGLLVNMGAYELFYWNNIFMLFCLLCGFLAQSKLE